MASFIAKQLVGKQLESVKGAMGDKKEEGAASTEGGDTRDPELEAALKEAEEKRQEKHRKMEEEREGMRQGIRDKYGIKKKEEEIDLSAMNAGNDGRLGRQRKTPDQLAAEKKAEEDEEESIINMLPENVRGVAKTVVETPQRLVTEAQEKCSLM